jgi:hypothetical protein
MLVGWLDCPNKPANWPTNQLITAMTAGLPKTNCANARLVKCGPISRFSFERHALEIGPHQDWINVGFTRPGSSPLPICARFAFVGAEALNRRHRPCKAKPEYLLQL